MSRWIRPGLACLFLPAAATAARLPVPVQLTERPLEQPVAADGPAVDGTARSGTAAAIASDSSPAASSATPPRTPGALLLYDSVPPLASDHVSSPTVEVAAAVDRDDHDTAFSPPTPASPPIMSPPPPSPRRARHHRGPSPPPHPREVPLLGNLTVIAGRGSRYVRTHVGVEAACALLLAALLSLCSLGFVARAYCDYPLCTPILSRGGKPAKITSPRVDS